MTHSKLGRSLLGLLLVLVFVIPTALSPTATGSAASSPAAGQPVAAQAPQAATSVWAGWYSIGDLNGNDVQNPVIGQNQDGHLEVFAWANYGPTASDHAVYRTNQIGPNSSSWTAWTALGTLEVGTSKPAVMTNPSGRMEVFAWGSYLVIGGSCPSYDEIKQIWQTAPNNGWSNWAEMGMPPTPACNSLLEPYVGMNGDGRLDVFAMAEDSNFYHRWQTSPSGPWSTGWNNLGTAGGTNLHSKLAVGRNADGRLALFAGASNNEIYQTWQNSPGSEYSWSGWTGFGKPAGVNLYYPVVGQNKDGRLEVFSDGSDGNLWHKWQVAPNSYWTYDWSSIVRPPGTSWVVPERIGQTPDGRMVLFARASDGAVWSIAQGQVNGPFGSWTSLGKPSGIAALNQIAIGKNKNGTFLVAAVGPNGALWFNSERPQLFLPLVLR